ncbi:MAG: galactose mutarotase [Spirochaetaceae bacterium]|jgi:aldose 1-epimerase|nr:galactose mutarotase [Spirochaetaceae bacterium]
MTLRKKNYGCYNSKDINLWTLESKSISFSLIDYGASWESIITPDKTGKKSDVLLGFSTLEDWVSNNVFMNATIGRFSNRIAGASFTLDGETYRLEKNDGENCLHGGSSAGFHAAVWKSEGFSSGGGVFVRFTLESPDGEGGFPGGVSAAVTYGLCAENEISAVYEARVNKNCPLSLTNHAYFNLSGHDSGTVFQHKVKLYSSSFAALDKNQIPTGDLLSVEGSPLDFRNFKAVADGGEGGACDSPFKVDGEAGILRPAAEVFEDSCGRGLKLSATAAALQFYTGGNMGALRGKNGASYGKHCGFCLETESFPDSPNQKAFPSVIFGPGRDYAEKAVFTFTF